jgi:hypothetical protein
MGEPKIVITGTGRSGTTLLVQLLDALGLDTGLAEGKLTRYAHGVRAGLECRVDDPDAPRVVKDMTLGFRMRSLLEAGEVQIAHVLLPSRRLDVAVASRVRAAGYGKQPFRPGGLTGTLHATEQEEVLVRMRHEITSALDDFGVPYTELEFPRFALDATYAFECLSFLVPTATPADVARALEECVRPDLIHEEPLTRHERRRARLTTVWMRLVRLPIARVRRWLDPEGSQARLRAAVVAAREREEEAAAEEARRRSEPGAP